MPLIASVTVASFAATDGGRATIRSSTPTAATIALIFMSATSGADYTARRPLPGISSDALRALRVVFKHSHP
jgi:hypothetical protein